MAAHGEFVIIEVERLDDRVTRVVLDSPVGLIGTGYSIRCPGDVDNSLLGTAIASQRAFEDAARSFRKEANRLRKLAGH